MTKIVLQHYARQLEEARERQQKELASLNQVSLFVEY